MNEENIFKDNLISKFSGIHKVKESKELFNEYKKAIDFLEKKGENNLNDNELEIFFNLNKIKTKIKSYTLCKTNNYFIIDLYFEPSDNGEFNNDIEIQIVKQNYRFTYIGQEYYCFIQRDMERFFRLTKRIHSFFIYYYDSNKKMHFLYNTDLFFLCNIKVFSIDIDYQYQIIDYNKINLADIYNKAFINKGSDLSLKLGLYVPLSKEEYNEFKYYNTDERENFYLFFTEIITGMEVFGLCGPYGTGKTCTLLRMIIQKKENNYFYINLATLNKVHITLIQDILRYEIMKLFGEDIFPLYDTLKQNKSKSIYLIIVDLIKNLTNYKDIFSFLETLISLLKNFFVKKTAFIIIDQYSSEYVDDGNKNIINKIVRSCNQNIHLIICSSMDNGSVKQDLSNCLDNCNYTNFFHIYVGSLIRFNKLDELTKDENEEFVDYLNDFGYLPLYYYNLKQTKNRGKKLESFIMEEKERIELEIDFFYNNKNNNGNTTINYENKFRDISRILSITNNKRIYFFEEMKEAILNIPLKYLEIKKEKIDLDDLELYGLVTKEQKIINFYEKLEANKENVIDNIEEQKRLYNMTIQFINEEHYCKNYISKISNRIKKILKYNKKNYNCKITIFYFDYLFPLIEEILIDINYNLIIKASQNLFYELHPLIIEGFFEYLINSYANNKGLFLGFYIKSFEKIDNFVVDSFFLQNYSSRKTDTIKTYVESKSKIKAKKDLPNVNIYFQQNQFTGKYYDSCLLIYQKNIEKYILYLLLTSKKKISHQRFYKQEHEIIFNRVKDKIENEYNIQISEGHFSYILIEEDKDNDTIKFCENNNLDYILFSIKKLDFINVNNPTLNDKTLITKDFPIHNSFSILPKDCFNIKDGKLENIEYIQNIQNKIKFESLPSGFDESKLNSYFVPKHEFGAKEMNEFFIFGHFDECFKVNSSFCRWLNNNDLYFYYYNKEGKLCKSELQLKSKLNEKKYTLICSKYKIINKS